MPTKTNAKYFSAAAPHFKAKAFVQNKNLAI
jgi:hypothetical protein